MSHPEETFHPYIASHNHVKEFTLRATLLGLAFGFFFAVANAYLALKIGTTVSASIPAAIIDAKIFQPSSDPRISSLDRSGCGIIPRTFLPALRMPAMLLREPFGFASGVISPLVVA